MLRTRRNIFTGVAVITTLSARSAFAGAAQTTNGPCATLILEAREALRRHSSKVEHLDVMGIADFGAPSRTPRFHILNLNDGSSKAFLVAHGKGSDPSHTGWLQSFSNAPGSEATSQGSYVTGETYTGHHGLSKRLAGLDPQNSNAASREIVMHSAWYVSANMASERGMLGRSQGCLAFAQADYDAILARMGAGRFIYAGKA